LLDTLGLRRAEIATALSGQAVIVKRLALPPMRAEELAEAIPWKQNSTSRLRLPTCSWTIRC
ncbi:MAG: hypothetical protein ABIP90_04625, partial [Vicinamibacterales bacterium]